MRAAESPLPHHPISLVGRGQGRAQPIVAGDGAPARTRTPDPPVRNRLLCSTELLARLAERARFELAGLVIQLLSKQPPSAARPPLRMVVGEGLEPP